MSSLYLTDAEVADLCAPLTQPAAQLRYLRQVLKLSVSAKPNGRPVVIRSHAERVLSGAAASEPGEQPEAAPAQRPNREALILRFGRGVRA